MMDPAIKYFYRALIQYKGAQYCGWQVQSPGTPTVQGTVGAMLQKLSQSPLVHILGSGRTDAGVHAIGQVARFGLSVQIPPEGLKKGLNSVLPDDIRVKEVEICDEHFHPQFQAMWKTYYYLFTCKPTTAFNYEFVSSIYTDTNFDKFSEALALFKGEHDFKHYQCTGTPIKNTVREMFALEVFNHVPPELGLPDWPNVMAFKVTGSGFLKQMVRLIAGTVFEYSRGKLTLESIRNSLTNTPVTSNSHHKRLHLAPVAPPQGLYLFEVGYSPFAR
ncbi:MAG: tRNA pseudouridine(38-40) synthase TruA [Bdellovibrio sp.]|nr:tRNA pseudouridine(38-40) synthase TruA [Bdellovibrio sp.]